MKKKMSRLISALLVFAMVCAMVPAAFADTVAATSVTLDKNSLSMILGGNTATLTPTVSPENATDKTVTWTSEAEGVATVANGVVTAVGAGTTTIRASVGSGDGTLSAKCSVTVYDTITAFGTVSAISVGKGTTAAAVSEKLPTNISATFADSVSATYPITGWTSANYKPGVAGTYTFTATLMLGTGVKLGDGVSAPTVQVTVADGPVFTATPTITGLPTNGKVMQTGSCSLTVNASAKVGETPLAEGALTYQWYVVKNGTTSAAANGTGKSVAVDLSVPATLTYYCEVTATNSSTGISTKTESNRVTLEVCAPYKIVLTTGITGTSLTVGSSTTINAEVQKFDETKHDYVKSNESNEIVWDYVISGTSNLTIKNYATLDGSYNSSKTLTAKAADSASGTNVTITAKLKVNSDISASLKLTIQPGKVADITYSVSGIGASFAENDFYSGVLTATGYTSSYFGGMALNYIKVTAQSGGALYTSAERLTSSDIVSASTKCYYNYSRVTGAGTADLDTLYFVPSYTTSATPYVTYTAYDANDCILATGKVLIDGTSNDITYNVTAGQSVTFNEKDFQTYFENEYTRGTLSYVQFDVTFDSNLDTRSYGYLYESNDSRADLVDNRTKYYYNASTREADLDTIIFSAGSRTTKYTITVPFEAYGTDRYGSTKALKGNVVITANDGRISTIYSVGTSFEDDIFAAMIPEGATTSTLSNYWVLFGDVTNGRLYYDYDGIADAKEVTSKTVFFFNPGRNELDLEDVYFVPAAGATTAKVEYVIYTGSNSKVESGSLNFTIVQQTKSNFFTDVTESATGKWSANAIDFMSYNELVTGITKTTFQPEQTMTRAMLVTILYRIAGKPSVSRVSNPFTDVKANTYYYDAVLWAYDNNVVSGITKTTFSPNSAVTREQIAAILYRYAGSPKTSGNLNGYTDRAKVSAYAETAMAWAVKNGIITGKGAYTLAPAGEGTRAEVAVMLHRYLTK